MASQVSFPGEKGPRLSDLMRDKLDRAYRDWNSANCSRPPKKFTDEEAQDLARYWGRVEGCAAQLGILRSTSTKHEIEEAKERHERANS